TFHLIVPPLRSNIVTEQHITDTNDVLVPNDPFIDGLVRNWGGQARSSRVNTMLARHCADVSKQRNDKAIHRRSLPQAAIAADGRWHPGCHIKAGLSKHDVYWGVLALRDVGTARSIPVLKSLLHYPMQDVKDCSLLTIAHIAGASETPFYVEALADRRTRKVYPMWAIEVAADHRAEPVVLEFVKAVFEKRVEQSP